MRIAVVGVPQGESSQQLSEALAMFTGQRLLIDMSRVRLDLTSGACWFDDIDMRDLDGVLIKKIGVPYSPALLDRLQILRHLKAVGVPVFSDPNTIVRLLNRLSCTVELQMAGIPMPPTIITENMAQAIQAVRQYGRAVLKPLYSTKAAGMLLLEAQDKDLELKLKKYQDTHRMFYIQKALDLQGGMDLSVVFLGQDYLTTYARVKSRDSWNTTTASGGHYESYTPALEIIALARRAMDVFKLVFSSVDIALSQDGAFVFEVSAFGGFKGIELTGNLRPAELLAEFIVNKIERNKK
ncbi:MAG: GAK system ATP-grasp enzyme [Desulfarculales bacterium]|jgi:ribosomal protein S6--L-glutamate ligase|nr:GAK system ATP-grasp enzyme [Desulfarculales bacterium]